MTTLGKRKKPNVTQAQEEIKSTSDPIKRSKNSGNSLNSAIINYTTAHPYQMKKEPIL